jgi:hypothetical protein
MGGRGGSEAPAAAPAAPEVYAAPPAAQQSAEEKCAAQSKAFAECMSRNNADLGACQFYFESMQVRFWLSSCSSLGGFGGCGGSCLGPSEGLGCRLGIVWTVCV